MFLRTARQSTSAAHFPSLRTAFSSSISRSFHVTSTASLAHPTRVLLRQAAANMADQQPPPQVETAQKPKTEKELANEKKKAEKAARFAAKQAKAKAAPAAATASTPKAEKAPKAAAPELPPFEEKTAPGSKKITYPLDDPHFSAYSPKAVESAWYEWWEASGFFKPENRRPGPSKGEFVIPLPPPNVTGRLHCGHALANALQDTLIRWHRMRGYDTLWVPGCDHAGISTQSVVEKMLWNRQKKTRMDLGREKFTETVWEWKGEYHKAINEATKLMGGSMDWSREAFTMDENLSKAVKETFVRLFEEGYIYRSNRLVNWCTKLNTALSTLEVENKEIPGRTMLTVPGYERKVEFGVLTHFKYKIEGSEETVEVATTRPETMLGDSGIAVHPDDKRYTHLVGKNAVHPFIEGRLLKIVADTYVDPEFGTGAVKLTPAHDFNDYNLGKTHNLEFINILNDDGTLNANAGPFQGQKRFDARYTVVEELTKLGLFVKKEPNPMKIPICEKSKDVIEPLIKPQWWMSMKDMASEALKAVDDGRIKIVPESANKSYHRWMENVNDWCISRQLWWGHQIPAYRVVLEGDAGEDNDSPWVVGKTDEEARQKAEAKFPGQKFTLERDPDCLDTWFSSGLWPFSTLGWPNTESPDFKKFFPTSVLETGWDILFFWVARMIMFSLKLTGEVPFKEVYCHSLIRDSEGRKMSKSLGNVIDPLDIISGIDLKTLHEKLRHGNLHPDEIARAEKYQKTAFPTGIPECGADALRFTLISYATGGSDINFDIKVMAAYRRFCNKVWQASKYVLGKLPENFTPSDEVSAADLTLAEKWILHRMNEAVKAVNEALDAREFSRATRFAHTLFYDELCDVFIENSKTILQDGTAEEQASTKNTLYRVLDTSLRLLHPFMPFITEELWQRLPRRSGDETKTIMLAEYPEVEDRFRFEKEAKDYELGVGCAQGIRSLAAEYAIKSDGSAYVKASTPAAFSNIESQIPAIRTLAGKAISSVIPLDPSSDPPRGCAVVVINAEVVVLLDVGSKIADNVDAEIKKVKTKLAKSEGAIQKQEELMGKEGWEEKVSETVRAAEARKLADAKAARENYEATVRQFEMLKVGE